MESFDRRENERRGLDYYGILGITKSASDEEIKKAYKRLGIKYNPLRNKCSDSKMLTLFALIGEAYEVLSNPLMKCIYDQYGEAGLKKGVLTVLGWNPPWQYHGDPYQTFKNFFGSSNPYTDVVYCMSEMLNLIKTSKMNETKDKQSPIERDLELTLEEVFFGTMKKIKIQRQAYDKDQITTSMQEKILCIRIRPGLPNGTKIIFKNVGDEGPRIIPGDLIVTTKDIPHKRFRRDGVNLHMNVSLDLHRAMGEMTIELTTIDCRIIRFAITDILTPGYTKTIKGEGMPSVDDRMNKGDLIIAFDIVFPQYLTDSARKKMIEAIVASGSPEDDRNSPELANMAMVAQKMKKNRESTSKAENEEKENQRCEDFLDLIKEPLLKL